MQVVRQKRGGGRLKDRDHPPCAQLRTRRMMTVRFKFQTATMRTAFKIVIAGLDR